MSTGSDMMTTILKTRIDGAPFGLTLVLLTACAVNLTVLARWL
ncbi:hypothetical protein BJ123_102121 [Rhodopseudomonas thermotolerans]|uniref:Uncharacterized protein n=2 Tax=Rhodopseudomonas TaxID=1073 RepID=A0A336JHR6_9BRAD|nr:MULTISPECIES: hypothetical protein [Rhodopseudomonas]RED41950.1 hypothetical protein BJ125_102119 [Rhodopseudomonas pentothenatexigens]REG07411.1 hypothetical protein BJ123_102121 [Rhodopseudomonas thermotolerans]SSW89310.1 hypothetical protein SAMN05892882_102119 [Rhodopseudomonas pentothenatexigens]